MSFRAALCAGSALLLSAAPAVARMPSWPLDSCILSAAQYHQVNPTVLKAIVFQESSGRPSVTAVNRNGSVDYGAAGINSVHLPELSRHGIGPEHLLDGCTSVYVGAWKLSKKMTLHGNTWKAIGAYHSETPDKRDIYIAKIQAILARWGVI